jgi:Tol biopolymer transport system component
VPVDDGAPRRLTSGADFYPSWSPDGSRIAFFRDTGPGLGLTLYVVQPHSGNVTRLAVTQATLDYELVGGAPRWSPDSREIAFARCAILDTGERFGQSTRCDLASVTIDRRVRRLGPFGSDFGEWSPDGHEFVAIEPRSRADSTTRLVVREANGHATLFGPEARSAHWSPDGKLIAFERSFELFVLEKDTGRIRRGPLEVYGADSYSWSPDGQNLAVATADTMVVVDAQRGRVQTVLAESVAYPRWQPSTSH